MYHSASLAAVDFASSPAGWLTGIGTPMVAALVGFQWKASQGRMAKLEEATAQQSQALAILVAESSHVSQTAGEAAKKADSLTIAMAVLQSQLANHERWHENRKVE